MKILYLAYAGAYIWHFVDEDYMFDEKHRDQLYKNCIERKIAERVATANHAAKILALTPEQYKERLARAQDRSVFECLDIYPVKFADNYKVEVHEIRQEELG